MKAHSYIIDDISIQANDVIVLNLIDKRGGPVFSFKPGQYAMLMIRDEKGKLTSEHAFSIASSPTEQRYLQFGIKILGNFTQRLSKMTKGAEVYVYGPYGDFTFDQGRHNDAVYIAGGVGITPFMSVFRYAFDKNLPNKLTLLYSAKTLKGALYFDEIRLLEEKNRSFRSFFAVTDEDVTADMPRAKKCFIDAKMISESLNNNINGKDFFVCGPPGFMNAMIDCLKGMGVPQNRIRTEKFAMNPSFNDSLTTLGFKAVFGSSVAIFLLCMVFVYATEQDKAAIKRVNSDLEYQRQTFLEWINSLDKEVTSTAPPTEEQPVTTKIVPKTQTPTTTVQPIPTPIPAPTVVEPTPTPTVIEPTPAPQPAPIRIIPRTTVS